MSVLPRLYGMEPFRACQLNHAAYPVAFATARIFTVLSSHREVQSPFIPALLGSSCNRMESYRNRMGPNREKLRRSNSVRPKSDQHRESWNAIGSILEESHSCKRSNIRFCISKIILSETLIALWHSFKLTTIAP